MTKQNRETHSTSFIHPVFASLVLFALLLTGQFAHASSAAPWGHSKVTATNYKPQKVVYDVTTADVKEMNHVLNRASYLSKITGTDPFEQSIVLVLHGPSVELFAIENTEKYDAMLKRAQSLTVSQVLSIRMCKIAAKSRGYLPKDIHGFVEMIPMGDAEIIRLQHEEGHAYMQ